MEGDAPLSHGWIGLTVKIRAGDGQGTNSRLELSSVEWVCLGEHLRV